MGRFLLGTLLVALVAAIIEFIYDHSPEEVVVDEPEVSEVVDPVVPALPVQNPYTLTAVLDANDAVVLDGFVPSEESKAAILARAREDFGDNVTDRTLRLASGAPDNFTDAAMLSLDELDHLVEGRLSMRNEEITLTGRAESIEERREVNAIAEDIPANFNTVINVSVPDAVAETVGQSDDVDVCNELLATLNARNELQFATGSSQLRDQAAENVLGSLASGMNQCPGFNVMVEGHASQTGSPELNMNLSKDRAAAVVRYLTAEGVDGDRFSSEGYGETRPKVEPTGPNSNIEANRRIEFIVSRPQ